MTGDLPPTYRLPEGVLQREVQDEMVLLDLRNEQYYGLDRVGADIVRRLLVQDEASARSALEADYEVDAAVLSADTDRLLTSLITAGLLERTA